MGLVKEFGWDRLPFDIRISSNILNEAIELDATEIHIVPGVEVYFRIDGALHRRFKLPPQIYPHLVTRIKEMTEESSASRQQPVTDRFTFRRANRYYAIDVTFPPRLSEPKLATSITAGGEVGADEAGVDEAKAIEIAKRFLGHQESDSSPTIYEAYAYGDGWQVRTAIFGGYGPNGETLVIQGVYSGVEIDKDGKVVSYSWNNR